MKVAAKNNAFTINSCISTLKFGAVDMKTRNHTDHGPRNPQRSTAEQPVIWPVTAAATTLRPIKVIHTNTDGGTNVG